jgi:hypothetical protein
LDDDVRAKIEAEMRKSGKSFEEHAQNGVRRETVPDPLGGARRTLCASKKP